MKRFINLKVTLCIHFLDGNITDLLVISLCTVLLFMNKLNLFLPSDFFYLTPGDCCSVDRNKYQIQIPLPPKIDPSVTMMTVEEKPDVTYNDVGGCKEQIEKMREV